MFFAGSALLVFWGWMVGMRWWEVCGRGSGVSRVGVVVLGLDGGGV